jgi:Na+/proline symporter
MEAHTHDHADERIVYVQKAGNGLAVAGFVCALVGAFAGLIPIMFWLALPLGVLGVVFGIIGRRKAKRDPSVGRRTMATWAVALGVVACGLGVWGAAIVANVGNDLDCLSNANTQAQIDACN